MGYTSVERVLNVSELQRIATLRVEKRGLINKKYKILASGIFEHAPIGDDKYADIIQYIVCDQNCNESKIKFTLEELDITPAQIFNYYLYRYKLSDLKLGDAIRVVKPATEDDPDWFAYNAILVRFDVRQLGYITMTTRGPLHRYLTARQAYNHGIQVYVYKQPDDYEMKDNIDLGYQCDLIR